MKNPNDQVPILRFLNKHKWRIILPMLFNLLFWGIPRYQTEIIAAQQSLTVRSGTLKEDEIEKELKSIQNVVLGDAFLADLVSKYDLYEPESTEEAKIEKLRKNIDLRINDELVGGSTVIVWTHFPKENSEHVAEIASDLAAPFESVPSFHIDRYESKPYNANPYRITQIYGALLLGFFITILLIFLWEIPQMFYSPRTKEAIFYPLQSDWERELRDARLAGHSLKALEINIRYSFAFVSTIFQKSPAGDLFEFVKRVAS